MELEERMKELCRPYRAYGILRPATQGAALGWYKAAPLGLRTAPLALRT